MGCGDQSQLTHYWLNSKMSHFDWKLPIGMVPVLDHEVFFCMFCGALKDENNASAGCSKRPKGKTRAAANA